MTEHGPEYRQLPLPEPFERYTFQGLIHPEQEDIRFAAAYILEDRGLPIHIAVDSSEESYPFYASQKGIKLYKQILSDAQLTCVQQVRYYTAGAHHEERFGKVKEQVAEFSWPSKHTPAKLFVAALIHASNDKFLQGQNYQMLSRTTRTGNPRVLNEWAEQAFNEAKTYDDKAQEYLQKVPSRRGLNSADIHDIVLEAVDRALLDDEDAQL